MRLSLMSVALVSLCAVAQASSPDAWRAAEPAMTKACFVASGFKSPVAASKPALFGDDVGYMAMVVTGTWPQPHMKGAKGTMLCLYNSAKGTAAVSELAITTPGKRLR